MTFPRGNLAPEGSVIKSTAIDPTVVDADGVYRKTGPARVFTTREGGHRGDQEPRRRRVKPGDVLVLICRGPMGAGMEEIYQITSALKHLSFGKHVAVLTDARFSGVSTGACIGHVGPEALAGGPIGKVRDGDRIRIVIDRNRLEGTVDLVGEGETLFGAEEGARVLAAPAAAAGPGPGPEPAGRHAAVGRAAASRRRHLGRLRLRRGRHRRSAHGQPRRRATAEAQRAQRRKYERNQDIRRRDTASRPGCLVPAFLLCLFFSVSSVPLWFASSLFARDAVQDVT